MLSLKGQEPHFGGMPHRQVLPEWKVWTRQNPHLGRDAHRQEGMLTSSSLSSEEAGPLMPAAGCPGFLSFPRALPRSDLFGTVLDARCGRCPSAARRTQVGARARQATRIPATLGSAGDKRHFLFWGPCGASPCSSKPPSFVPNFLQRCVPPSPPSLSGRHPEPLCCPPSPPGRGGDGAHHS